MESTPLKRAVEDAGLRQDWLAEHLGVSPQAVSAWVNGRRTPSEHNRDGLCLILRRKPSELGFSGER